MNKRKNPDKIRSREDSFENVLHNVGNSLSDPRNLYDADIYNESHKNAKARFPGVEEDGVAVPKRQSTDLGFHGGINSTKTHVEEASKVAIEPSKVHEGFHVHNALNPYGLHIHAIGQVMGGWHSHSPSNSTGAHTHKYSHEEILGMNQSNTPITVDGHHQHQNPLIPDGGHKHGLYNLGLS